MSLATTFTWSICQVLDLVLVVDYCNEQRRTSRKLQSDFEVAVQWSYLNFTWPSRALYEKALSNGVYIPENNAITGLKYHDGRLYVSLPKLRPGTPVTLASIPWSSTRNEMKTNPLLKPYPSWEMNLSKDCSGLKSAQSMEIDTKGIMWVLDGNRIRNYTNCPGKIVLLDMNDGGKVIQSYTFTREMSQFLNDLVVEETDGGYAYITESSDVDPGLIVFSRRQNRAWKIRDRSMFAEIGTENFLVDGLQNDRLVPVDGIAMSPLPKRKYGERKIFYTALTGFGVYSITNTILKNEALLTMDSWRRNVEYVGDKLSQSDGMIIDNKGTLYYGLLSGFGIAKWNSRKPFSTTRQIAKNIFTILWPDSFTIDSSGFIYVITNSIHKYFSMTYPLKFDTSIKFRIFRAKIGTKSYLYEPNT